jgi:hypothetical protein
MENNKVFIKGSEDNFVNDIQIFGIGNVNEDKKRLFPDDMIRIGNELYLFDKNKDNQYELRFLTKDNNNIIERLFPFGIKQLAFQQGGIGDCYYLSPAKSSSLNSKGAELICKMVDTENSRPDRDSQNFKITFPGYPKESFDVKRLAFPLLRFPKKGAKFKDLNDNCKDRVLEVQGDLGIKVLEEAFFQLRKRLNWHGTNVTNPQSKSEWLQEGFGNETGYILTGEKSSKIEAKANGYFYYSYKEAAKQNPFILKNLENTLKELGENKDKFVISAGTGNWKDELVKNTGLEGIIVPTHAYSVADVDPEKKEMTIIDPHDSRKKVHIITYDDFFKYFRRLYITQLDKE